MIPLLNIPRGSIIIASSPMIPYIKEQLSNSYGMIGIDVVTLNTFIKKYMNEEEKAELVTLFEYRKQIKMIYDQLVIYDKSALTYTFLKECYQFIEELKRSKLEPSCLSDATVALKEMKMIIQTLYPILSKQDMINQAIEKIATLKMDHVYIYPSFIKSEEQAYIDLLYKQNAKVLEESIVVGKREFYSALNKKEEIEGCAQYILRNDLDADDIQITLANQEYLPLMKQIFDRYQIPFTVFCRDAKSSICAKRFVSLMQYYLNSDLINLKACLDCGAIKEENLSKLQAYIEIFEIDIDQSYDHLSDLEVKSHLVSDMDLKRLNKLESEAEVVRIKVYEKLNKLKQINDYEQLFLYMIELVNDSFNNDQVELQVLDKIVDLLKAMIHLIQDDEDVYFMMIAIENLAYTLKVEEITGVAITSINQGRMQRNHHFILGVDNKNFPAFPNKKGIFDEAYYATTPLMSQQARYEHYMKQINELLHHANHLYVSYSVAGYDGKGKEAALEIETLFKNKMKYPLKQGYYSYQLEPKINQELAKEIYLKDHKLYGSISSLEKYINCPFAYFVRYGLGVQEPIQLGFSPSYMGTLTHYVLECLGKTYGKDYVNATQAQINALIEDEILALAMIFPNMRNQLSVVNLRIQDSFKQRFKTLKDYEKHSLAKPSLFEQEFQATYQIDEENVLQLKGIIDRIDQVGSAFVILDYKSSKKKMSKEEFESGRQLQLVTYSVNYAKQQNQKVLGSYYVSMKNENIEHVAYKSDRRKKIILETSEDDLQAEVLKNHVLVGYSYHEEANCLDDNAMHINGFRIPAKSNQVVCKVNDIEELEAQLEVILKAICKKILSGDIAITPSKNTCDYCKYQEICRHKDGIFEKLSLLEEGDENG